MEMPNVNPQTVTNFLLEEKYALGAANSAVQSQGQISPTIRVRMGEPIRVFTARDLDFSTVGK